MRRSDKYIYFSVPSGVLDQEKLQQNCIFFEDVFLHRILPPTMPLM